MINIVNFDIFIVIFPAVDTSILGAVSISSVCILLFQEVWGPCAVGTARQREVESVNCAWKRK